MTFRGNRDRKRYDVRNPDLHQRSHRGKWTHRETLERRADRRVARETIRGERREDDIVFAERHGSGPRGSTTVPLRDWAAGQLAARAWRTGWNLFERWPYDPALAPRYAAAIRAITASPNREVALHFARRLDGGGAFHDFRERPSAVLRRVVHAQPGLETMLRAWIARSLR